jgi:hypothetical protein
MLMRISKPRYAKPASPCCLYAALVRTWWCSLWTSRPKIPLHCYAKQCAWLTLWLANEFGE